MRAFVSLVFSGGLWLLALQLSPLVGLPPQAVSLARSGYLGIFSIFLLLELRSVAAGQRGSVKRPGALFLYATPMLSVVLLSVYSDAFVLNWQLGMLLLAFYACQFCLLTIRHARGETRNAFWELVPPALLVALSLDVAVATAALLVAALWLLRLFRLPVEPGQNTASADAVIVQLPALILAPTILIGLRDFVDLGPGFDRADIETIGMVVNGLGSALWTAIVLRGGRYWRELALAFWVAGVVSVAVLWLLPAGFVASAGAILVAEAFRGSVWIGTTALMAQAGRRAGFTYNLIGTALPLSALFLGKSLDQLPIVMLVYGIMVLPISLLAWFRTRNAAAPA